MRKSIWIGVGLLVASSWPQRSNFDPISHPRRHRPREP
jgi:hypothetical protein